MWHKNSKILSGIQFYKTYNSNETKTITSNYIRENLWVDIYNSSFINSEKKQVYHKSKLVVGVENLPYKSVLKPILGNILLDFGGTVMSRAFKPMPIILDLVNENFSSFSNIIFFMGKSGREIFQNTLKDWDLDYSEKKSLTSNESFLLNVKKIKKKFKKN